MTILLLQSGSNEQGHLNSDGRRLTFNLLQGLGLLGGQGGHCRCFAGLSLSKNFRAKESCQADRLLVLLLWLLLRRQNMSARLKMLMAVLLLLLLRCCNSETETWLVLSKMHLLLLLEEEQLLRIDESGWRGSGSYDLLLGDGSDVLLHCLETHLLLLLLLLQQQQLIRGLLRAWKR